MEKLTQAFGFDAKYVVYPILALAIAGVVRLIIRRYLQRWARRTESQLDDHVVNYLDAMVTPLVLIAILYYLTYLLPFAAKIIVYVQQLLIIAGILVLVFFSARLATSILKTLAGVHAAFERFIRPLNMLSNVLFALIGIAMALRVLAVNLSDEAVRFVRIIGIATGAYVLLKIIGLAVVQMERMVENRDPTVLSEAEKRARTLGKIINNVSLVLVLGVAIMMVLSEFGIDITPIITGAGIAGLAVGFGAQNLVRDIISGFFLILEDQIRVGDVAKINGVGGVVEGIRIRTTVLRDIEGTVHIFPNGEIKQVANLTKEFSYYVVDVGVAYKENVDRVMEVLRRIGEELAEAPDFKASILEPLEILGVDDFGDSKLTIKIRIKTLPLKQWAVGRELRKRIKGTFDREGIEIPFPHLSVYFGEASKPFGLEMMAGSKWRQEEGQKERG